MESQDCNGQNPQKFHGVGASTTKKSICRKGASNLATSSTSMKTRSATAMKFLDNTPDFVLQNQPIKRQKLDGGRARQIVDAKHVTLPHKSRPSTVKQDRKEIYRTGEYAEAETESAASSTNTLCQNGQKPVKLREPKTPHLQTAMRAQLFRIKGSEDIQQEQVPMFKARPLNKKIFKSKGSDGVFTTQKHIVTEPHPFHFQTEERRMEKQRRLLEYIKEKEYEDRDKIPKALPYPYSTDYPVIPPKPEPKECTKADPFHLESVLRHEQELERQIEHRQRMEQEEAQKRIFKAQPIMKEDPYPVPEKVRIPCTDAMDIELNVDLRAVERAQFDNMIKEKETLYMRYKEEREHVKMLEVEKEIKQLRKAMVPHARPLPYFDNPFIPQKSSKEPTIPQSPHWHVVQRKQKYVCGSSSSSNIR